MRSMISDLLANFSHLEVHYDYTLLGGTSPVSDLAARTAADGMSALALTDTNALYGVVAFAKACRAAEVQPIIGMAAAATRPAVRRSCPPDRMVRPASSTAWICPNEVEREVQTR
jgi:DNA polymerase III alpha subunit